MIQSVSDNLFNIWIVGCFYRLILTLVVGVYSFEDAASREDMAGVCDIKVEI